MGILVLALAAALSACSDDSDGDDSGASDTPSEITIECDEFEDAAALVAQAQADLYAGTGAPDAIDTLVAELEALEDGAPADVQAALTDMAAAFQQAAELLENPSKKARAELAELAPELAEDSRTITDYVVAQCE